jgi:hypothetical protein
MRRILRFLFKFCHWPDITTVPQSFLDIATEVQKYLAEFARGVLWRKITKREQWAAIFASLIQLFPEAQRLRIQMPACDAICKAAEGPHLGDPRINALAEELWQRAALECTSLIAAIRSESAASQGVYPAEHYRLKYGIPARRLEGARRAAKLAGVKPHGRWLYRESDVRLLWPEDFV